MIIHNFSGKEFEIEIDKENTVAVVKMEVTGDEILGVLHKDGTQEWYDSDIQINDTRTRRQDFIDDYYFVKKEEW